MTSELDLLKQLREITGAGVMDCKKYLKKSNNDVAEAVKLMRSEEGIKADKKSSRIAAEGVVYFYTKNDKSILIEINSETDFVARSDDFMNYTEECCSKIIQTKYFDFESMIADENKIFLEEIEEHKKSAITKLGENIVIRRFNVFDMKENCVVGYTHNNKIGAVVILEKNDETLAKDICMQIVASNPISIDEKTIDQSVLSNEKDIYKLSFGSAIAILAYTSTSTTKNIDETSYRSQVNISQRRAENSPIKSYKHYHLRLYVSPFFSEYAIDPRQQ